MFAYYGPMRVRILIGQAAALALVVIFSLLAARLLALAVTRSPDGLALPGLLSALGGVGILVISWVTAALMLSALPTIWLDSQGIHISTCLFFSARIPWAEVIDVGAGRPPAGTTLVRARHITPLHRLYGRLYSRSWYPGFLIGRQIEHYDLLVSTIQQRGSRLA